MELFYIPHIEDRKAFLEGEEHHHLFRVLRKQAGDLIMFTDGQGGRYQGTIAELNKKVGMVDINASEQIVEDGARITVITALTKNIKRMEWAFEKLTELGVRRIIPVICQRSERERMNSARMHKILIAAMKQSERCFLPECPTPALLSNAINLVDESSKYLCYRADDSVTLKAHYKPLRSVVCLIGPEGDFTDEEVRLTVDYGFVPLSLGTYRLRTETAGVAFAAAVQALNMK